MVKEMVSRITALRRPAARRGAGALLLALCAFASFAVGVGAKEKKPVRLVRGVVSDKAENPIAGAVVTLTDLRTGKATALYTGKDGVYQFSGLEMTRDYEVQATFNEESSRARRVSTIDPRNIVTLNLRIPPLEDESDE